MSQLEVDKVIPQSGTTLTLGDSADTITIPSGATLDASNATVTIPAVNLTTGVTGTLPVANGGTNLTSGFANGITMADQWRLTTTINGNHGDIVANLAVVTLASTIFAVVTEPSGKVNVALDASNVAPLGTLTVSPFSPNVRVVPDCGMTLSTSN